MICSASSEPAEGTRACGIVYISHRLEELAHIVDRVTIMRDGQYHTQTVTSRT
ncbi:MAG: hypothetical protein ACLU6Y_00270 [Ruminococcus sp.]